LTESVQKKYFSSAQHFVIKFKTFKETENMIWCNPPFIVRYVIVWFALICAVWSRFSSAFIFKLLAIFLFQKYWRKCSETIPFQDWKHVDIFQRNWMFATNSNFLIPISLQRDSEHLGYFKLRLYDSTELLVWNI